MPSLRPIAIAAGVLGSLQAIVWIVFSLLGIRVYTGDIPSDSFDITQFFNYVLLYTYFVPPGIWSEYSFTIWMDQGLIPMSPGTVVVWTSIYFGTSVIWLGISGLLLYDSCKSMFTSKIIIGWVAISAVIAVIDLAGTIAFGVDYNKLQRLLEAINFSPERRTYYLQAPIFMMIMCARGFIFWIMNVGMVIYLGLSANKLNKKIPVAPLPIPHPDYSSKM